MTNKEFIQKLLDVLNYKTVYMWGTFGSPVTEELLIEKSNQYPNWYNPVRQRLLKSLINKNYFGFDCVGLIKGVLWGWNGDKSRYHGGARYNSNGVPDVSANMLIDKCNPSSDFNNILPGEVVWLEGHVGVYIGNGQVIECTPAWENGVQITSLRDRKWLKHGKLPWINYTEVG
jgi:cell wall-associated NlpC family hydrolase